MEEISDTELGKINFVCRFCKKPMSCILVVYRVGDRITWVAPKGSYDKIKEMVGITGGIAVKVKGGRYNGRAYR